MNKPVLFLRIAAVLTLIHAVLHTVGGVFGAVDPGPAATAVQAMKANIFPWMGQTHSFWEFYRGLGLTVTIFLTAESVLMWQLVSLANSGARRLRPMMITLLLAYAVMSIDSYEYFFLGPVIMEILIALCFALAFLTTEKPIAA